MELKTSTTATRVHESTHHEPEQTREYEYEIKESILASVRQASIEVCHQLSQSTTTITLSGPTLFFILSSFVISLIHIIFHLSVSSSILAFCPLAYFIHHDYKSFLSLGPGGTPSTFVGYLKISYLRLYALSDPFLPPPPPFSPTIPAIGYFKHTQTPLPWRVGPRPTVDGIAPQRQRDSFPSLPIYLHLRRTWIATASAHSSSLETKKSCFEKQGLALFSKEGSRVNETCRGEIAHVHAVDGSFHMSLHSDDVAALIAAGWGQRHPLAGRGPDIVVGQLGRTVRRYASWMGWKGRDGEGRAIVPSGFVLVYAPRDERELEVVGRIVKAGAWWVMGREIELEDVESGAWDLISQRREAGVKDDDHVPGYTGLT